MIEVEVAQKTKEYDVLCDLIQQAELNLRILKDTGDYKILKEL
jgi:hypothetical protein